MPTRQRGTNAVNTLIAHLQDPAAEAPRLRALLAAGESPNLRSGKDGTPLEFIACHFGTNRYPWSDDELAPIYDEFFTRPDLDFENETDAGYDSLHILRGGFWQFPELVARVEAYVLAHTGTLPPDPRPDLEAELRMLRERFGLPQPLEPLPNAASAAQPVPKGPQYDAQYCASVAGFFELHPELLKGLKKHRKEMRLALTGAIWNRALPPESRSDFVAELLTRGADPNYGRPPRGFGHSAASLHNVARGLKNRDLAWEATVIRQLLDAGADPNCCDMTDGTPLETVISTADSLGTPESDLLPLYDVFLGWPGLDVNGGLGSDGRDASIRLHALAIEHPLLAIRLARAQAG